jgi:ATP-dependent Clp protease ATP-binding subunit ClpB
MLSTLVGLAVLPAEKAWEAIISAPEVARGYSQQIVETEHLFKALLEQPNGLARRILSKAGANPTQLLDRTDAFIRKQPRISGNYEQILGRTLEGLVNRAEELKQRWQDQYVSVEELVAAMADDKRFGQQLFRDIGISPEKLEEIIQEIRGGKTWVACWLLCCWLRAAGLIGGADKMLFVALWRVLCG